MSWTTHSYAILEVSAACFEEISERLLAGGYQHAIRDNLIDMHGLALRGPSRPIVTMPNPATTDGEPALAL